MTHLTLQNKSEARVLFKAEKNHDGYFNDNNNLVHQVEHVIDIFEQKTNGFKHGLFLFDNATTHQKCAPDTPSARKMMKGLKLGWTHWPNGPCMCDGTLLDGTMQFFYFPDNHSTMPGWFKGMQAILQERGL
jgi:hypothetical protein